MLTVGWHTASDGPDDAHGNPTVVYTPPLDAAGRPVRVMGWAPTQASEPTATAVEADLDLLVPPGVVSGPRDVVDVPDAGRFEVVGYAEDWSKGPFGFPAGIVVKLRRVEGR